MPSLPDTAVIIFLGLLLFGPKGLAQIARQLGKLMGEFRRASNEFRMQMEEELRISEQADRQKAIAAIETAAPVVPALTSAVEDKSTGDHASASVPDAASVVEGAVEPLPIASSGDLSIMPPATGLPAPRSSSLAALIDSVPKMDAPSESNGSAAPGGHASEVSGANPDANLDAHLGEDQRPTRYTGHDAANGAGHPVAAEESLHG